MQKKLIIFVHEGGGADGDLGVRPCLFEFMLRNII